MSERRSEPPPPQPRTATEGRSVWPRFFLTTIIALLVFLAFVAMIDGQPGNIWTAIAAIAVCGFGFEVMWLFAKSPRKAV